MFRPCARMSVGASDAESGSRLADRLETVDDARNPVSAEVQQREERADEHHFADQRGRPALQVSAFQDEDCTQSRRTRSGRAIRTDDWHTSPRCSATYREPRGTGPASRSAKFAHAQSGGAEQGERTKAAQGCGLRHRTWTVIAIPLTERSDDSRRLPRYLPAWYPRPSPLRSLKLKTEATLAALQTRPSVVADQVAGAFSRMGRH